MHVNAVLELIKKKDVKSAYAATKVLLGRQGRGADAFLILRELQAFCNRYAKTPSSIDFSALYNITNECCATLSRNFETVDEYKFSNYLFFIFNALLQSDVKHCEPLIDYFFTLKSAKSIITWNSNVTNNFSCMINAWNKVLENNFTLDLLTSWFSFVSKMYLLDTLQPISRLISGFNSCLGKINQLNSLDEVFKMLRSWEHGMKLIEAKEMSILIAFVQNCVFRILILKGGLSQINALRSSFEHFKSKITNSKADLELFSVFLRYMCASDNSTGESALLEMSGSLSRSGGFSVDTLVRIAKILSKSGPQLPRHKKINTTELKELLKVTRVLFGACSKSKESVLESDLACLLQYGLTVFHVGERMASDLVELHAPLKQIFDYACALKITSRSSAEGLVESMGRTLHVYKKCQQESHAADLSILALKLLYKLEPSWLNESTYLKWWADRTLGLVASFNVKSGTLENALIALVAFSALHKDYARESFKCWAEVKTAVEGDKVGQVTVHDIIQTHSRTLETEWPPFKSNEIEIGLLLLFELLAYLKKRGTRNKPVVGVYKVAARNYKESLTIVPILTATIDSLTTETGVAELGNLESSISNVLNHLKNLLRKETSNEKIALLKCLLGNVYYVKLRFEITRLRKTMENKVLASKNDEIPVLQIGVDSDDTDSSKVNPEFDFLALSNQEPIMKMMTKTVNYWLESVEWMAPDVLLKSTLGYMKGMAYLYRLHYYREREMEMWELLYRVSVKQQSCKYQVLAVSEMLSICKTVNENYLERAKVICETQEQGFNQNSYEYQQFYINYAKNLFLNGKAKDCGYYLNKVEEIRGKTTLVNVHLAIVNYFLIDFKMNQKIMDSFGNLLYIIKNNQWVTFNELSVVQWLLLELTYYVGSTFCDLRSIRRARTYVHATLSLAKQLVLPLRTCRLLHVLGSSDAVCSDVKECEIKLSGMGTILELEALLSSFVDDMDTSVQFMNKSICKPQFVHHGENCSCLLCGSVECQCRSLDTVNLKIACSVGENQKEVVENLVDDGLKIISIFESRTDKQLITSMAESKTRFLTEVTKYYFVNHDLKRAWIYLEQAEQSAASDPALLPLRFSIRVIRRSIECLPYMKPQQRQPRRRKGDARPLAAVVTPERKPPQPSVNAPADHRVVCANQAKNLPPVSPKTALQPRKIFDASDPPEIPSAVEPSAGSVKTPSKKADGGLLTMTPISYPGDLPMNSAFKTPMAGKTKRIPVEKKVDLFRTPVLNKLGAKQKCRVQVFCDDDNASVPVQSTSKNENFSVNGSSSEQSMLHLKVPSVTYGVQKQRTRRLARVLSSSDSDEDAASGVPETAVREEKKPSHVDDDESIIEITPPKAVPTARGNKSTAKKPLKQESLEEQFQKLTVSSLKTDCGRTTRSRRKL